MTKYEHLAAGAPVRIRRTIPSRAPTVQSDVLVPALAGLLLGALAAILPALVLGALLGHGWAAWLGFASVFCTGAILWRLGIIDESLWASESIESTTGLPPSDGLQMPALPAPGGVVLLNPYAGREQLEAERREEKQSGFADFVTGCQFDTSARRWSGEPNYTRWRESLIASGWGHWRKDGEPRAGWELTAPAERVIEAMDL